MQSLNTRVPLVLKRYQGFV